MHWNIFHNVLGVGVGVGAGVGVGGTVVKFIIS